MIDVLFVIPNSSKKLYQDLANTYSAIEPPTWALLLAESVRSKGYKPAILDVNAEQLSHEEAAQRIEELNPKLDILSLSSISKKDISASTSSI